MPEPRIPVWKELLWPTLRALRELGGSGSNQEIVDKVIELEHYDDELVAVPHGDGPWTEIQYRLNWARSNLKALGAVENSARAVWALTDYGRTVDEHGIIQKDQEWRRDLNARRRRNRSTVEATAEEVEDTVESELGREVDWKQVLLEKLWAIDPDAFERLAQRLLREAGFQNVVVTGRSGDGGIDGVGIYRPSLISFHTFFQCKRYRGSVTPGAVRDFRGAMAGRGDKGILITTGTFTRDARAEASRDGAPPIDLIDGQELCELLRLYRLGVETVERIEMDVVVRSEFFDAL